MRTWAALLTLSLAVAAQAQDVIRARVDLVVVPASVRDGNGKFIYDLKPEEFVVYEDGRLQQIQQFSTEPAPLSAVVLIDTGLGRKALQRFAGSIISLSTAFTPEDEAEVYRFDSTIIKLSDFTNNQETLEKNLAIVRKIADGTYDHTAYPLAILPGRGPRWLRWLLDRGIPPKMINDALFTAAVDLQTRAKETRKLIILISDGQAVGTPVHSLEQTRDRLVQNQIQVYGVAVGAAVLGGSMSILHTYADATGGEVYGARTQNAMESAVSRIMAQARHQYVLGYISNNEVPGLIAVPRKIEVAAKRPGLKVNHRKSYLQYPAPK